MRRCSHVMAGLAGLALAWFMGCGVPSSVEELVDELADSIEDATASEDASAQVHDGTVSGEMAGNADTHEETDDYTWDSTAVAHITLNGSSIAVDTTRVTVNGRTATIGSAGTYEVRGSLTDGQLIVNTAEDGVVRLILSGVTINKSTSAPLYIAGADKAVIVLADGTSNYLADGTSYVSLGMGDDEPTAPLFSMADLTICGGGALTVRGNYNDGIACKDGLIIAGGTLAVTAVDDGIRGKDYLVMKGGSTTVTAGGDGLKADNDEDAAKGYIAVEAGALTVVAGGDAVVAATDVLISGGSLQLTAGGGSTGTVAGDASAKGLKGGVCVVMEGGTVAVNAADDAVHSDDSVAIRGGSLTIASGDDGMHGDESVVVAGGDIRITKSYEGVESEAGITIAGGELRIVASDDGINVAGGNDGSGWGPGAGPGMVPTTSDCYLEINGGRIVIDAMGDGIDVNGAVRMTAGEVLVNGPTADFNGALDHLSFTMTGGFLVAVGSAGMAQAPGMASTQYAALVNLRSTQPAGTLVRVQTRQGSGILTFAPTKRYQSIAFSSPALAGGTAYDIYLGGSATGTVNDGLYENETYTPGTYYGTVTLTSVVTVVRW